MVKRGVLYTYVIALGVFILTACGVTDYMIKINNEAVTKQEFDLYLMKGKEFYENQGGEDIWQTKIDGEDPANVLKNDIVDTITRTKIRADIAKKKNIKFDDAEKKQLDDAVKKYMDQPNKKGQFSKEVVEKFVYDNMISVKLYDYETQNIEITEQMFNDYLKTTGTIDTSKMSEEELKKMKEDYYASKKSEIFEQKYNEWKKNYNVELNTKELSKIQITNNK